MRIQLTGEELKEVELNILCYLKSICEELNLSYYLMGGTLLGAIRHKGFIPWDDDIDVMMPRSDYDKLISYFREHSNGRYQLADRALRKDYSFPIGKLIDTHTILTSDTVKTCANAGAFVDIFPLDRVLGIEDVRERCKELGRYNTFIETFSRMLPKEYIRVSNGWCFKERLVYYGYRLIGWQRLLQKYESICRRYNNQDTGLSAYIGWILYDREIWSDELLGEGVDVSFENHFFKAPSDYDKFLTTVYGDYMKLPPKEKRITRHSFRVYWK